MREGVSPLGRCNDAWSLEMFENALPQPADKA